ncbi:MAG: transcriptional regulator, partial [Acidobacteria bacterium]|nr:transcriptional regulator [Acidobacteriota bacterium]
MARNNALAKQELEERPRARAGGKGLPELDRLIHERMRLGIVSALAANQSVT